MRTPGYTIPHFGPRIPIVKSNDFSHYKFEHGELERIWEIVGPSAVLNMRRTPITHLWKVITMAYLEGLHHGSEIEKERHAKQT